MSPLKIMLLLRCHAYANPNADLPEEQAFAPAMVGAIRDFIEEGLIHLDVTPEMMRAGRDRDSFLEILTARGLRLVHRLMAVEPEQP